MTTSLAAFFSITAIDWGGYKVPDWLPHVLIIVGVATFIVAVVLWLWFISAAWSIAKPKTRATVAKIVAVTLVFGGGVYVGSFYATKPDLETNKEEVNKLRRDSLAKDQELELTKQDLEAQKGRVGTLIAILEENLGQENATAFVKDIEPKEPLGPLSLVTQRGISAENFAETKESRREELSLRQLSSETEVGRPLADMPIGSYSFAYPGALNIGSRDLSQQLAKIQSYPERTNYFEIRRHKSGEFHLVAFMSEESLPDVTNLTGLDRRRIDTFAWPTASRSVLVEIPVERVVAASARDAAEQTSVEFTIR